MLQVRVLPETAHFPQEKIAVFRCNCFVSDLYMHIDTVGNGETLLETLYMYIVHDCPLEEVAD